MTVKPVEGFEPPNDEVATHDLKPLGYTGLYDYIIAQL